MQRPNILVVQSTSSSSQQSSTAMDTKNSKSQKTSSVETTETDDAECAICFQPFTLKATLPGCGHSFCFLCIKGVARRRASCPLCRQPIHAEIFQDPVVMVDKNVSSTSQKTTTSEDVRCRDSGDCSGSSQHKNSPSTEGNEKQSVEATTEERNAISVRWFYQARHGGWWRYEQRQERDIEEAFQKGLQHVDLLIAGYTYCIDFVELCQFRKDLGRSAHWKRAVKRVEGDQFDGLIRGIAGLRTSSCDSTKTTTEIPENVPEI